MDALQSYKVRLVRMPPQLGKPRIDCEETVQPGARTSILGQIAH